MSFTRLRAPLGRHDFYFVLLTVWRLPLRTGLTLDIWTLAVKRVTHCSITTRLLITGRLSESGRERDASVPEQSCPKGDACALNSGAVQCKHCGRHWPPDETWERGFRANHDVLRMACHHGYPVRVYATAAGDDEPSAYDGWVRGSETPSSVTICQGKQEHRFEYAEIEDVSFFTPLAERLTGAWLRENL